MSFTEADKARGKVFYNVEETDYAVDELPGYSVFYKDEAGTFSTPTRRSPAAPSWWAGSTVSST